MSKCLVCGIDIPPKGYNNSGYCLSCYKQSEKSLYNQKSTEEQYRRRQEHFGYINLNETMLPSGYGNLKD